MAHYVCADCSWQGNALTCPLCGGITESLHVEEVSGLPSGSHEVGFASGFSDLDFDDDL